MSGIFSAPKPDTSAAMAQIERDRKETKDLKDKAMAERREAAKKDSSTRLARRMGGKRALLSSERGYSEIGEEDETLGA